MRGVHVSMREVVGVRGTCGCEGGGGVRGVWWV